MACRSRNCTPEKHLIVGQAVDKRGLLHRHYVVSSQHLVGQMVAQLRPLEGARGEGALLDAVPPHAPMENVLEML